MSNRNHAAFVVSLALAALPGLALASVTVGDAVGTGDAEIRAALEAAGYTVDEIERDDSEIEVDAALNGKKIEIGIAADTGLVIEIEADD